MGNRYSFVTEYDIVIKLFYNNGGKLFLVLILLSWLSGIVLYGFGHLIVTQDSILKEQKAIANELRKMRSSENKDVDDNYVVKDIELPKL